MGNISTEKKQEMQVGAGSISYESLAEGLNKQLQDAYKSKASFQAYKPEAVANAEAIGSFEGRAPGESPVDIRAQGITTGQAISAAASGTQKNILDVLTSMMNLKKEKDAADQKAIDSDLALKKLNAELAQKGMVLGEDGQPRGMTPEEQADSAIYQSDPLVWLRSQKGGNQILAGVTGLAVSTALAEAVKAAGGVEQYLNKVNRDALFNPKQLEAVNAARALAATAEDFLGGNAVGDLEGLGPVQGVLPDWMTGYKGKKNRQKIASIINDKIKSLSGAAVSDQEAKRLQQELSSATSTDESIRLAMQNVVAATKVGEEMNKKAILNNMSLSDAYKNYGAEAYSAAGLPVPEWLSKQSGSQSTKQKSAKDYADAVWGGKK